MKDGNGLSTKMKPRWDNCLNPIFPETSENNNLAAESANLSCIHNFSEDPGNESYLENEVSNFSDDEGISFSTSFSLKSKLFRVIGRR